MKDSKFIVRVYGIHIDPNKGLLVSDEYFKGRYITKFPGGGLEYGEGTIDCLKREMIEETGSEFDILSHFYTTDFFIESAFHTERQIISIYYLMSPAGEFNIRLAEKPFDFEEIIDGAQSFRFISLKELHSDVFTFPIDKHVAELLRKIKYTPNGMVF